MATRVYLGVGSNLNKENALRFAVAKIGPLFKNFEKSSVWVSHAIRAGEPDYYNMVFGGDTEASLMFNNGTNFGVKRRLDIDILVFGDTITTTPCKLPRHDIQDYPFVLCPLCELDPNLVHPLLNVQVGEIWQEMEPRLPENRRVVKTEIDWSVEAPQWHNVKD